jgi:MFS family permease
VITAAHPTRALIAPLYACFAGLGIFWGAWAALLPDMKVQVQASDGELGLALLFAGAGSLPAMALAGRAWRRLGWWLMPLTGVLFGLAVLGPILATSPLTLAVALVVLGAASGALDVSMNAAVSDLEAGKGERLFFGAHATFSLAVLVSAVATGFAREQGAEPAHVLAIVSVLILAATANAYRIAAAGQRQHATLAYGDGGGGSFGSTLVILAGLGIIAFMIDDSLQSWSAIQVERTLGAGPALGGAAPGIFAGAMFVGRALGQRLGGRFTDRMLVVAGALAAGTGAIALAFAPTPAIALAGVALAGLGVSPVAPALFARAGRLARPSERGAAIARMTIVAYLGFLIGPALVGWVSQVTSLPVAISLLAFLALGMAAIAAVALRGRELADAVAEGEELLKTSRA